MGAKQSKRSVDISGKEAESAGEVAAAGAGGEGRVEQLADADALKPQLNGDAHIHEPSDKEKEKDSSTPENEKDATTEKENKEEEEKPKEEAPVTNGDSEPKPENEETAPTPEDGKKPKKEKVKKKWSLRSISFSRKDKPKQEKKQKDEEPKTNGEPEKALGLVTESTPVPVVNEVAEEVKVETEVKEEKTPETPVTEPITNGSSTPETPKVESPATEELEKESPQNDRPETVVETEPEQLPVNGLSLEEPKVETIELPVSDPIKPEEPTIETPETAPVPEIPVQKEVCVDQMPLIEPSPPPLPANPPPSSVVSFAATTMAPELTDASLANTADITTNTPLTSTPDSNLDKSVEPISNESQNITVIEPLTTVEIPSLIKESTEKKPVEQIKTESNVEETVTNDVLSANEENLPSPISNVESDPIPKDSTIDNDETVSETNMPLEAVVQESPESIVDDTPPEPVKNVSPPPSVTDIPTNYFENGEAPEDIRALPTDTNEISIINSNETVECTTNGQSEAEVNDETEKENLKNKTIDSLTNVVKAECNGDAVEIKPLTNGEVTSESTDVNVEPSKLATPEDSMPPSLSETIEPQCDAASISESFPLPPSELCRSESEMSQPTSPEPAGDATADTLQDPLPITDKMAELIPEVPTVPELITQTETTTDVAVDN